MLTILNYYINYYKQSEAYCGFHIRIREIYYLKNHGNDNIVIYLSTHMFFNMLYYLYQITVFSHHSPSFKVLSSHPINFDSYLHHDTLLYWLISH